MIRRRKSEEEDISGPIGAILFLQPRDLFVLGLGPYVENGFYIKEGSVDFNESPCEKSQRRNLTLVHRCVCVDWDCDELLEIDIREVWSKH